LRETLLNRTALIPSTDKSCRPREDHHPANQEDQHIQGNPQNGGPARWKLASAAAREEKHIHQIGSGMGADVKTENHSQNTIHNLCAG